MGENIIIKAGKESGTEPTVCIIPARGGSKRLPGKNIREINGKPLLAYTIEAALGAECFSDVYVSSDDDSILEVAQTHNAKIDARPAELALDDVGSMEVVDEFLCRVSHRRKWDNVAMCLPTCPFRTASDIQKAMAIFMNEKDSCPRLIGLTKCSFPPHLLLKKISGEHYVDMREPEYYGDTTRSQSFEVMYYPNGSIYIATIAAFKKNQSFWGRPMLSYIMPEARSLDIDYPYQLEIAEYLAKKMAPTLE